MSKPQIRFRRFTGEWRNCIIEEIATVQMNKRIFKHETKEEGDIPFYKIGTFGGVADAYISKELYESYKKKFPYPQYGDILLSASGSIGKIVEYIGKDEYFQDSNIIWLQHDSSILNIFLKYFYEIVKWHGLEGSTIKRLYNKNILDTRIDYPHASEQTKIGNFFKNIDRLLSQEEKKHVKLINMKKALLEKMFPQKGKNVPQVRFKGFDKEWERKEYLEVFDLSTSTNTFSRALLDENEGVIKNIHYGDILIKFGDTLDPQHAKIPFIADRNYQIANNSILKSGDIVMADAAEDNTVGKAVELLELNNTVVVSGLHTIVSRPLQFFSACYMGYYLNSFSYRRQLLSLMQGIKVLSISKTNLSKTSVAFPFEEKEQTKIGELFKKLDKRIELQQTKITKLKNMKKALLDTMFV